jgi:non-homologous end joining protein Ku
MPDTDNILVAVSRDDARELLLARGWTMHEENGEFVGATKKGYEPRVEVSDALFVALLDEAAEIRSDRACHTKPVPQQTPEMPVPDLMAALRASLEAVRKRHRARYEGEHDEWGPMGPWHP